jgi:signal transduction histidine kinase
MTAVPEARTEERVVVIDDDAAIRLSCQQILARMGLAVEAFADGAQGLAGVARAKPGLVVVDLKMPGLSGLEVLRRLHAIDPTIVVVVITGYATIDTAIEAMKAGAYDFLPKPFAPDQLRVIVDRALERRRLERESRRREVESEMLKRRFVSFVSHQLKTPLAAVHQYLDLLARMEGDAGVEAKRRDWIRRCLERSDEMRRLIDEWLTLARIEGGSLGGRREPVDLAPLLARVVDGQAERAARDGLTLTLALEPGPGGRPASWLVEGDPSCFAVLFENLIDNALKYNRSGGSVAVVGSPAAGEAVVEVRDTGEGIAAEALPFLFEEFFRARSAGKTRGSGLGLAICRRIAAESGGGIEVESRPGEGSTFRVRLPIAAGEQASDAPCAGPSDAPEPGPVPEPRAATVEKRR